MSEKPINPNLLEAVLSLQNDDAPYWQALGMFIESFSLAEFSLLLLLFKFSGIREDIGKAVSGGMRIDPIIANIRRVWEANPIDEELHKEFSDVLTQMKGIADIRNLIIHYCSATSPNEGRIVSNLLRVHVSGNETKIRVSPETLTQMTNDLIKIAMHAYSYRTVPNLSVTERAETWIQLKRPWQYKLEPIEPEKVKIQRNKGRKENRGD